MDSSLVWIPKLLGHHEGTSNRYCKLLGNLPSLTKWLLFSIATERDS